MLHHNWVKTTGRVIDSRIRKVYHDRADDGTLGASIPLHNYIVEFRTPDGQTKRLEVEQHVETIDVGVGSTVPLLVSPDGTKAILDKKDPAINLIAVSKARKQADQERFRRQLES